MNIIRRLLPASTSPLTKYIRTLEGIAFAAFSIADALASTVGNLPATQGIKWGAIALGIATVSRTGLKVVAILRGIVGPPDTVKGSGPVGQDLERLLPQIAAQIGEAVKAGKIDPSVLLGDVGRDLPALGTLVDDASELRVVGEEEHRMGAMGAYAMQGISERPESSRRPEPSDLAQAERLGDAGTSTNVQTTDVPPPATAQPPADDALPAPVPPPPPPAAQ